LQNNPTKLGEKMTDQPSVVPVKVESVPETGRDPIRIMVEIAENKNLSDKDKSQLILYAQSRFKNRRRMAYIVFSAIIVSLAPILLATFIDGLNTCQAGQTCEGILASIKSNQNLIAWIEGFLTATVAAYYGASAWRPAS
jgi:hypothetical protein